jgi:dolichyl-phosphate-mannose--protein O-mannosyl transferase
MLNHGLALSTDRIGGDGPSSPYDWLVYAGQMTYFSGPDMVLQGTLHPLTALAAPVALAASIIRAPRGDRVAHWAVIWFVATYGLLCALAITANRVMYIHYMLPTLPAFALAIAHVGATLKIPTETRVGFLVAFLLVFAAGMYSVIWPP